MPATLYLIDGSGYIFRAYYAVKKLTTRAGTPVNAVYGFAQMLNKILTEKKPDYIAVCFDARGKTFRHTLFEEYKAHRPPPPEDLVPQFALIHNLVEAYKLPMFINEGVEADDVIATFTKNAKESGFNVIVVSSDKDLMQLVDDKCSVYDDRKEIVYSPIQVKEKFGVAPEQMTDYLALVGDSSDNVPGVPGIGPKTATDLIERFGTLDNIYAQISQIGEKVRLKLENNKDKALLSKKLVELKGDVDNLPPIEKLTWQKNPGKELIELYKKLEFSTLLKNVNVQGDIFGAPPVATSSKTVAYSDYITVLDEQSLNSVIAELGQAELIAVDTETTGINPHSAELVGISLSWDKNKAAYIPISHRYLGVPRQLPKQLVVDRLLPLLSSGKKRIAGQNIKYDYAILKRAGLQLSNISDDTMIAAQLITPEEESHRLSALAQRYLDHKMIYYTDVTGTGKNQISFAEVDINNATRYSAEDADITLRLVKKFEPMLEEFKVARAYREIEMPLLPVLAEMELTGIRLDVSVLNSLGKEVYERERELESDIYALAGVEFNLNSPKQLAEILFDKLNLPIIYKTKSGPSTDQATLEVLYNQHGAQIAGLLLEYRMLSKLSSTYIGALPREINRRTGRIHTDFRQAHTATGRLASSDPNLQNIPIRTPLGAKIREAFVPEKGWKMLSFDYSQIELRVFAHFAKDETLIAAFKADEDIHARTAEEIFGVAHGEVTKALRGAAKAINFGLVYGKSAFGLAEELGIPRSEAKRYIENYFARYKGVKKFIEQTISSAKKNGEVRTLSGRFRRLADITSNNKQKKLAAERMAVNTLIQGTAADIIKIAMVRIARELVSAGFKAKMLLQVHDELVFEAPPEEVEPVAELVCRNMSNAVEFSVPLKVDWNAGNNWGEAH